MISSRLCAINSGVPLIITTPSAHGISIDTVSTLIYYFSIDTVSTIHNRYNNISIPKIEILFIFGEIDKYF